MQSRLESYRHSLIVVVLPWNNDLPTEDDGIRYRIDGSERCRLIDAFHEILDEFKIDYLDMKENNLIKRKEILESACEKI